MSVSDRSDDHHCFHRPSLTYYQMRNTCLTVRQISSSSHYGFDCCGETVPRRDDTRGCRWRRTQSWVRPDLEVTEFAAYDEFAREWDASESDTRMLWQLLGQLEARNSSLGFPSGCRGEHRLRRRSDIHSVYRSSCRGNREGNSIDFRY